MLETSERRHPATASPRALRVASSGEAVPRHLDIGQLSRRCAYVFDFKRKSKIGLTEATISPQRAAIGGKRHPQPYDAERRPRRWQWVGKLPTRPSLTEIGEQTKSLILNGAKLRRTKSMTYEKTAILLILFGAILRPLDKSTA